MNSRVDLFLASVVGIDGSTALRKATSSSLDLAWAVVPRVIMAWVDVVAEADYDDQVPGVAETRLALKKSERGITGAVDIGDGVYEFTDATSEHVAGAIAVAIGIDRDHAPELTSAAMAKLGKSIDLLVKSRTLRKAAPKAHGGAKGSSQPGVAAAPRAPQGPIPPTETQPEQKGQGVGTKAAASAKPGGPVKLPGVKPRAPTAAAQAKPAIKLPGMQPKAPKKPTLKVTKNESGHKCMVCGDPQFKSKRYVGCLCFAALAKNVRTTATDEGYTLEFGVDWDLDAISALADNLGKY